MIANPSLETAQSPSVSGAIRTGMLQSCAGAMPGVDTVMLYRTGKPADRVYPAA
jgi:hypothetical protein